MKAAMVDIETMSTQNDAVSDARAQAQAVQIILNMMHRIFLGAPV